MFKEMIDGFAILLVAFLSNGNSIANPSPTINQIYQTAHSGNITESQRMMDQVLKNHPNSAKAHFVAAELFASKNKIPRAAKQTRSQTNWY
jgi:hypothetical protein